MLAVVTAVVDAEGASRAVSAQATLGAYRPALALITGAAAIGALVTISGLRRRVARPQLPDAGPAAATAQPEAVSAREAT